MSHTPSSNGVIHSKVIYRESGLHLVGFLHLTKEISMKSYTEKDMTFPFFSSSTMGKQWLPTTNFSCWVYLK